MSLRPPTTEEARLVPGAPPERPPGRSGRTLTWAVAAAAMLVLLALAAVALLRGDEPADVAPPADDPGQVEPEPEPAPEPEAPAPEVRYGEESPANWDVTGVAAGERLTVYSEPGAHSAIAGALAADAVGLESTGRIAWVDGALWRELKGAVIGWVDARYVTETLPDVVYSEEPRANWDVTRVSLDDVLNVRSGPGLQNPVIGTLPPSTVELESTGRIARVDGVLWREIVVPGATTGWVNATYLTETAPRNLPLPVLAMTDQIRDAAGRQDWDRLAELALAGDAPFTAVFDVEMTHAELAAHWRAEAARQPLDQILLKLIGMSEWYERAPTGDEPVLHISPAFMHEPTAANRAALDQAFGAELVESWIADGQYLGWRLGITADGDWTFFVAGD
jgi:hypothetical protein